MIQDGDILLIEKHNPIRYFMKKYGEQRGYDCSFIPTHAQLAFPSLGIVYESKIIGGFGKNKMLLLPYKTLIKRPNIPYNKTEVIKLLRFCENYKSHNKRYQYGIAIAWPLYIITRGKIDLFRYSDRINYCFEVVKDLSGELRPFSWSGNFEIVSGFDILFNINYKTITYEF